MKVKSNLLGVVCITVSTRAFNNQYRDQEGNPIDLSGKAMRDFIDKNKEVFEHIESR